MFVVIASQKEVKTTAVTKLFESNRRFKSVTITFLATKASSDIADQPVGIANGRLGALNRINNIKTRGDLPELDNIYICAIENYFEESETAPRDHAYVMIQSPDGQLFEAVSVGVAIHRDVYEDAIKGAEPVMSDEGILTGYSKTVGSYLQERYEFEGSDWFKEVGAGIGRLDQILTTLDDGLWF
jgi:non-canonical (house-cleaning) NTP pyrophosphatase